MFPEAPVTDTPSSLAGASPIPAREFCQACREPTIIDKYILGLCFTQPEVLETFRCAGCGITDVRVKVDPVHNS